MSPVIDALVYLIHFCYSLSREYISAIFLFTLLTKVILLPLSVWVQKNSIKAVRMQPQMNLIKAKYMGNADMIGEEQYKLFKKEKYSPLADLIPLFVQLALLMGVVEAVKKGTPLTEIPVETGGLTLAVPVLAAVSAFFMCFVQNKINVLQSEQGPLNKYGTMIFSVALSLYLGFFVSVGVGLYWTFSNILSVLQLILLNIFISPKKYIDYEALEASKKELSAAKAFMQSEKKSNRNNPYRQKEKADYKRFLKTGDKKIVFYSEKKGFYKYYKDIIEEIIRRTNIVIHYVTSDPEDDVFSMESEQFKPYYVGSNLLIILMMKLETKICVMTTPDLENYQLKRSYVKKDIEYIYVQHDVNSSNLSFHAAALDHYDTIFASGIRNKEEIEEREQRFHLPKKTIVEWGSGVIDNMMQKYQEEKVSDFKDAKELILIAPSWQRDNIMDSCIEEILDGLKEEGYEIVVRPHPQFVRHFESRINALKQQYADTGIVFQTDFSDNKVVYEADILITDWSSIAFEYSFSTLKPVLFINTPMKELNPDWRELTSVPVDLELRDKVGISLDLDRVSETASTVKRLLSESIFSPDELQKLRDFYIYNIGSSGKRGAEYIIRRLVELSGQ